MIWYDILISLCARLFLILVMFALLCRTTILRNVINSLRKNKRSQLKFAALFIFMAVADIFAGSLLRTFCVNNQLIIVLSAGLIGGTLIGALTGFMSSLIAYSFMPQPISPIHYPLMVVLGIASGCLARWLQQQKSNYAHGAMLGFIFSALYFTVSLASTTTLPKGYVLEDLFFPLLFCSFIGCGSFIGILEGFYNQQEILEGISAKTALKITNNTISILQNGLNATSASQTTDIILQEAETFDFVAITSLDEILGFSSYRTEAVFVNFLSNDFHKLFQSDFKTPTTELDVISSYINLPIYNDKHHVGYFCIGHILNPIITPFENTLAKGIGTMITNQITVHGIKEKAELLDKAEIKALQSQINPHFLFNALSTISYFCSQQPQTAKSLINDLASYYRNNLTDANTMISIRNELQHINAYIHLEQARFGDRLKVDYDIDIEEVFQVPALILQPIVENAIKHGLYPKVSGGSILIRIEKRKGYYRITVIDDGLGISKETLKIIFDTSIPKKSIGLSNVNQRLITLYGPKNHLRIYSRIDKGTIVVMRIPYQEVEENDD